MILYWIIFFIISYCAWYDWKKTVLAWISICLLFNPVVCLRFQPPNLQLVFAVNCMLFFLYLFRERFSNKLFEGTYLFKLPFVAYIFSYCISSLFSIAPIGSIITHSFQYFLNSFVIVFLFHKSLKNYNDIKFFLKINCYVIILIFVLGFYEFIFKDNPWLDYVYWSCDDADLILKKSSYRPSDLYASGEHRSRFGMVRAYSFFEHPIRYGCACAMYISLYLWLYNRKTSLLNKYMCIIMILLLLTGVIFCNSKTPFVGITFFFLAAMPLEFFISRKAFPFFVGLFLFGTIALSFNENIFDNFYALVSSDKMAEGGESTPELRMQQYAIGLSLWLQNPILGNGPGAVDAMLNLGSVLKEDIGGSESSWLQILPERGLIGVMAYLLLYYQMFQYMCKNIGKQFSLFFLIGLMAIETATGVMDMFLYGAIIVFISRCQIIKCKRRLSIIMILMRQYESNGIYFGPSFPSGKIH